jgi:DNA-binding FadR family transcriptional regulator
MNTALISAALQRRIRIDPRKATGYQHIRWSVQQTSCLEIGLKQRIKRGWRGMKTGDILSEVPNLGGSITRQTARDAVADKLTTLIATGMLRPGDELPGERELANVLNVSRETVRGAIQILAAKGFIEVSQGSRSRVADVDLSHLPITITSSSAIDRYDLDAVHGARLLVELDVVGQAVEHVTEDMLAKLDALLEVQREVGNDTMRFLICDREFHLTIYRACGNPLLTDFVIDLYGYLMDHRRHAMAVPGATAGSYADHVEIVDALKRRDRVAVVEAFRRHLTHIYETTREMAAKPALEERRPVTTTA